MEASDFRAGLEVFTDRQIRVQKQLREIEQSGMMHRHTRQYRVLLDKLVEIGMERAEYCSRWYHK